MTDPLARYRQVMPDWDAFVAANRAPEAVTLRVRRGLAGDAEVRARLEERGFSLEPVPGLEATYRVVDGPHSVAQTIEHWLGLFHVQQAVMALPTLALTPRPGERILDLCAAPGGKTVHLAELMADRGCLVAVDPREKRLRGLMGNVFRLGHPNVLVVAADGRKLPVEARFDRVLVDPPCSAEGNYRRQGGRLPDRTASFVRYVTGLQEALLRRAIRLTRPGGVLVYSTCTFAPEENEGVLDRVLRDEPVRAEPIRLSLPHAGGFAEWEGIAYHPGVREAWRVYPQHLDSGGMFMARLRRLEGDEDPPPTSPGDGWSRVPPAFSGEDPEAARGRIARAKEILESEYLFALKALQSLEFMVRKENIWVHTAGEWPVESWPREGAWRVVSMGLRAFRRAAGGWETPSNAFLTRFANELGPRRKRALTRTEMVTLLRDGRLDAGTHPTGPVALWFEDRVVGRGIVGPAGIRSEIPKARAKRLRALLRLDAPA
jgi:NOL1/NOP2/sun family putative RNA methylase